MIPFISLLAFYVAWNLGANDVANSMGTSVGSKAVTLRQALIIAGILEFTGAVLFGRGVSKTLVTGIVNPALFVTTPQVFLVGMVAVLLACGLCLQLATALGLPVSSSHAIVGAIAGFATLAMGPQAVNWHSIGLISLTWVITPILSGTIAALFYSLLRHWILQHPNPIAQLYEWIPWLSASTCGIFGIIVFPTFAKTPPIAALPLPPQDGLILLGLGSVVALTFLGWHALDAATRQAEPPIPVATTLQAQLSRYQLVSACLVAFAHGSNDVGNAIAPLAAIVYIHTTGTVPLVDFTIPLWIFYLGGAGIVAGLAVWGKNVIATIGTGIMPLLPSSGFCAELATATTVLLASRAGLPVSTSHALVGSVVGIGLLQDWRSVQFGSLRQITIAWLCTIPLAAGLGAAIFAGIQFFLT